MKISKIPGLGRFGVFIDDVDFASMTPDLWNEIGNIHLNSLVTILRNVKLDVRSYVKWMKQWGHPSSNKFYEIQHRYNIEYPFQIIGKTEVNGVPVDPVDEEWAHGIFRMLAPDEHGMPTSAMMVTGKRDKDGNPLGMFADGELLWHSNESGQLAFAPGVALLGESGVVGSSTGFVTTTDWYEKQTESFRSELDEMIIVHKFTPGRINPGLPEHQDKIMFHNMCPTPNELPLVIQSPAGIKGLHYSINTIDSIKGMTKEESQQVFDVINKGLFTDEHTYDHWYAQDNDLCLFDNSITLHRRLGGITNRMCYRIQYAFSKLAPDYNPYFQKMYADEYANRITDMAKLVIT